MTTINAIEYLERSLPQPEAFLDGKPYAIMTSSSTKRKKQREMPALTSTSIECFVRVFVEAKRNTLAEKQLNLKSANMGKNSHDHLRNHVFANVIDPVVQLFNYLASNVMVAKGSAGSNSGYCDSCFTITIAGEQVTIPVEVKYGGDLWFDDIAEKSRQLNSRAPGSKGIMNLLLQIGYQYQATGSRLAVLTSMDRWVFFFEHEGRTLATPTIDMAADEKPQACLLYLLVTLFSPDLK